MTRLPMPRVTFLMLALGGALIFTQQVAGISHDDAPATVLTVPAANVAPAGSGHTFAADMNVDDAAAPVLR